MRFYKSDTRYHLVHRQVDLFYFPLNHSDHVLKPVGLDDLLCIFCHLADDDSVDTQPYGSATTCYLQHTRVSLLLEQRT